MSATAKNSNKVTVATLKKFKQQGDKFTMLTAYDASFAQIVDQSGVDVILVGDSLGMVVQGHDSTIPVTVDHILYHTQCVSRVVERALVIADLPFMSFSDTSRALDNATRLMQEGGARAIKLEGGGHVIPVVEILAKHGIPVCAHLGLQPQYINKLGSYRVQGRLEEEGARMLDEAKAMQDAGADMLVLECIPSKLAKEISQSLTIPTIGIGAGVDCDAQVLVLYDVLGI
ncbi:MAG: 3-methyl-2-oxobutanoate hydroxymethyltransferase, partial [Gammaproteobacteria bacterium]|nr:3-methyl-2-oxobutanoate hydroxymethyltransferase [Gammaproteobacteria bacterium]